MAAISANANARITRQAGDALVIGLVNNMPDAALRTTERQFGELLAAAAGSLAVELRLYALPDVPRSDTAAAYIRDHYEDVGALNERRIDGLIVTGSEPRSPALADEPYWASFTKLVDWAQASTTSTIWSCLAAHAAVLHLDGVERRPFDEKLSGVFECAKVAPHALTAGTPALWGIPHSRYNDVPEKSLLARDYHILSRSRDAGVDMFVKQENSLFVFIQGHPEYDQSALLREYRRDVTRFLHGERKLYPGMPQNYFGAELAATLADFRGRAEPNRTPDMLAGFPYGKVLEDLAHVWQSPAVRIYQNWLSYLAEHKAPREGTKKKLAAVAGARTMR
jgi:homoserine O-succinyltransferase/O-acetyltransferase